MKELGREVDDEGAATDKRSWPPPIREHDALLATLSTLLLVYTWYESTHRAP